MFSCPQQSWGFSHVLIQGHFSSFHVAWVALNPGFPFRILSRTDFVSQLWKKSEGKPGRISPVIRWHHDVNPPAAKATRHTECLCYCFWEREDASVKTKSKATELPGMSQGSLFTKRSYKSQLDLLVVTASPKYWSLCMGATKKLPLKAQFCSTRINSWAT